MGKIIYRSCLFIALAIISGSIYAGLPFGLGPCCNGYMCGTIPCDSSCAGQAILNMGSSVSSAANNLTSAYKNLGEAIRTVDESVNKFRVDVISSLDEANQNLLKALSASTAKTELANQQATKSLERNTDYLAKSLKEALKQKSVAGLVSKNNISFGDSAQPLSGTIGADRAKALTTITARSKQVRSAALAGFEDYIGDKNLTAESAGTGIHMMKALKEFDENGLLNAGDIFSEPVTATDKALLLQRILGYLVVPTPLKKGNVSTDYDYEIERKQYNYISSVAYNSLIKSVIDRTGFADRDWEKYYESYDTAGPTSTDKHSLVSIFNSDVIGRLTDPEWYGSIKRLREAGLYREIAYQNGISSALKYRLGDISMGSKQIYSLWTLRKLKSEANYLNVKKRL